MESTYLVQVGRYKGAYKTRWAFSKHDQAVLHYNGLNVGNGYKKRLLENGKIIARELT